MTESGKQSKAMAESLHLPVGNAMEIDSTLGIISTIFMGPEFNGETMDAGEQRVVGRITGFTMLNAHRNTWQGPTAGTSAHCQTFCQSSVESLNPRYTMRHTKRMYAGDLHCEYAVELKK
jgi:hypothetical protein